MSLNYIASLRLNATSGTNEIYRKKYLSIQIKELLFQYLLFCMGVHSDHAT